MQGEARQPGVVHLYSHGTVIAGRRKYILFQSSHQVHNLRRRTLAFSLWRGLKAIQIHSRVGRADTDWHHRLLPSGSSADNFHQVHHAKSPSQPIARAFLLALWSRWHHTQRSVPHWVSQVRLRNRIKCSESSFTGLLPQRTSGDQKRPPPTTVRTLNCVWNTKNCQASQHRIRVTFHSISYVQQIRWQNNCAPDHNRKQDSANTAHRYEGDSLSLSFFCATRTIFAMQKNCFLFNDLEDLWHAWNNKMEPISCKEHSKNGVQNLKMACDARRVRNSVSLILLPLLDPSLAHRKTVQNHPQDQQQDGILRSNHRWLWYISSTRWVMSSCSPGNPGQGSFSEWLSLHPASQESSWTGALATLPSVWGRWKNRKAPDQESKVGVAPCPCLFHQWRRGWKLLCVGWHCHDEGGSSFQPTSEVFSFGCSHAGVWGCGSRPLHWWSHPLVWILLGWLPVSPGTQWAWTSWSIWIVWPCVVAQHPCHALSTGRSLVWSPPPSNWLDSRHHWRFCSRSWDHLGVKRCWCGRDALGSLSALGWAHGAPFLVPTLTSPCPSSSS